MKLLVQIMSIFSVYDVKNEALCKKFITNIIKIILLNPMLGWQKYILCLTCFLFINCLYTQMAPHVLNHYSQLLVLSLSFVYPFPWFLEKKSAIAVSFVNITIIIKSIAITTMSIAIEKNKFSWKLKEKTNHVRSHRLTNWFLDGWSHQMSKQNSQNKLQ